MQSYYNVLMHTHICKYIYIDMGESTSLAKWSSLELLAEEDDSPPPALNSNPNFFLFHRN